MKYFFEWILLYVMRGIVRILPKESASHLGKILGGWIGCYAKRSRVVMDNLKRTGFSTDLTKEVWKTWGQSFFEGPHLSSLLSDPTRLILEGDLPSPKLPAFYLSAHLGHILVQNVALKKLGVENLYQFYHPRKNPWVDQLLLKEHAKWAIPLPKRDIRGLMNALALEGNLLVLLDQKEDRGQPIPFFSQLAMTNVSLLKLSEKFERPLIPIQVIREGALRFRVRFYPPIAPDPYEVNALFETWIRQHPDQYFWFHKRWPNV